MAGSRRPGSRSRPRPRNRAACPRGCGEVPGLRADHLQQDLDKNKGLPEVRASFPDRRRRLACVRCSTTGSGRALFRPDLERPACSSPIQAVSGPAALTIDKTGMNDALIVATGTLEGSSRLSSPRWSTRSSAQHGVVVGEKLTRAIEMALAGPTAGDRHLASGGARMMEAPCR